ncbi:hypothetical protein PFY12_10165 [Chryseobacterium camelliae]|uniref:Uncharacterized protein n=1 Tax=Chryseobacterium camelliae TaxID=1265445 RepID=A0ABY7QIH0_9FLAO|nr:hypothetical protein [Chryseobacterium camelliae]WBV59422.1 hypothetical protein PFY12_10165 [Chryseobacterium camelliae]
MKKNLFFISLLGALSLYSCNEEYKEDEVSSIDKHASIETELSVKHIDTADVLITKHKIWKNNKLFKEIIKTDTIPALGDTLISGEDKDGYDQTAKTKKDYEFYITVQ